MRSENKIKLYSGVIIEGIVANLKTNITDWKAHPQITPDLNCARMLKYYWFDKKNIYWKIRTVNSIITGARIEE